MKKSIIGLTIFAGFLTVTAWAKDTNPNSAVLRAFQTEFRNATNVVWQQRPDFAKVNFNLNGSQVEAYFALDGQLIGTARTILFNGLPLAAMKEVDKRFPASSIYNVTECNRQGETFYILTVEQGSKKLTVKLSPSGDLTVEEKIKL